MPPFIFHLLQTFFFIFLKTLNGIPDQDTYYDIVDSLEEQGMENVIQYYMSKQGTDLDLLQQFQIYEVNEMNYLLQINYFIFDV